MTIGEKIRNARRSQGLTQTEVAGERITRNMLSRIECGTVTPSLDTVKYLSETLGISAAYLLSEDDDLLFFLKKDLMPKIRDALSCGDHEYCIKKIEELPRADDELAYILVISYFERGKKQFGFGSLKSALKSFEKSNEYMDKTVYRTVNIAALNTMYIAMCKNIQAPLLEFEVDDYVGSFEKDYEYDLYKYLTQDTSFNFKDEAMGAHFTAKKLIKERKYAEAIEFLTHAVESAMSFGYNPCVIFAIYTDLELCYKQLYDFENAYRYSTKRMSMLEGFKT